MSMYSERSRVTLTGFQYAPHTGPASVNSVTAMAKFFVMGRLVHLLSAISAIR